MFISRLARDFKHRRAFNVLETFLAGSDKMRYKDLARVTRRVDGSGFISHTMAYAIIQNALYMHRHPCRRDATFLGLVITTSDKRMEDRCVTGRHRIYDMRLIYRRCIGCNTMDNVRNVMSNSLRPSTYEPPNYVEI